MSTGDKRQPCPCSRTAWVKSSGLCWATQPGCLAPCQLLLHWRPILEVVVQSLSYVRLFATPWTAARQTPLSSIISQSLFKFMSIGSVMLSSHLFLCCPLLLFAFYLSQSFPMSWLFVSAGQTVGISASVSVLPMNIQGWLPLGLTSLILLFNGLSRVFSSTTVLKHQFFSAQPYLWSSSHICVEGVSGQSPWVLGTPAPATL